MGLKNYDVKQVTAAFFGFLLDSGMSEGDFIQIKQVEADWGYKVGADGQVTRYAMNNPLTEIKVFLMQSSDGNAKLSTVRILDKSAPNGAGVGPCIIRDRQGTSVYESGACWIVGPPDAALGKEPGTREWTLHCVMDQDERFDGGN